MSRILRKSRIVGVAVMILVSAGCGSMKTSGTARTGTEQLLLSNAWDTALQKVDFSPLTGVPVYLDTTNASAVDQGWVVSSIRQALLSQGALLRSKPEEAQWIVEARVGAYGTDAYNWLLGIAQTTVPPTVTGMPSGTIPEMSLIKKSDQRGVAKLALFAYDRASGQMVWQSGTMAAVATAKDVHVLGVGPIQSGSIRGGTEFVGMKLPLPSEPDPTQKTARPPGSLAPLEIREPATSSDRDGFAP